MFGMLVTNIGKILVKAFIPITQTVTLASDIAVLVGDGDVTLCAQSDTSPLDNCTKFTGLLKGHIIYVRADAGDSITLQTGTYLHLQADCTLTNSAAGYIVLTLLCVGDDICWEQGRSYNT